MPLKPEDQPGFARGGLRVRWAGPGWGWVGPGQNEWSSGSAEIARGVTAGQSGHMRGGVIEGETMAFEFGTQLWCL